MRHVSLYGIISAGNIGAIAFDRVRERYLGKCKEDRGPIIQVPNLVSAMNGWIDDGNWDYIDRLAFVCFLFSFLSLSLSHTHKHIHVFYVVRFSSPFQCTPVSWHLFHPRLPQGTDLGREGGHRRRKRTVENHPDFALSLLYSRAFLLPVVIRFIVNPVWRWGNTGPRESPRWCLWEWKWHLLFVHLGILPSFFL